MCVSVAMGMFSHHRKLLGPFRNLLTNHYMDLLIIP
jgi:hypothetical protein